MAALLTEIEAQSAVWLKVSKHIEGRIETLRKQNDGDRDTTETAKLRGRIAAFKEILDLTNSPVTASSDQVPL